MAQILRNNIIIGTAAIKDLVVSDNSKTQQTVKFVRIVDQYENIDIPYDTFKEFEYGDVVIDNVLYGDIPASGGSVSPRISYHQTKVSKGHSGLRYLQDDISEGAVITFSGKIVDKNGTVSAKSLGTTSKSRSVIDTVTVTISLNGKTSTKTVNVYQSENTVVANDYSIPEFTNKFSYDVFGAVGAESVVPSVAPKYIQTKSTRYSSGEILYTNISTGGVLKFMARDNQNNFTLVNASTGAISTMNRTVPGNVYGDVSVMVTLNGKSSPSQTIQICQEGVQRWYNGSVHTPKDIVSMGLNKNGKDRLFIPLAETTNSPLCIFRSFKNDALKFSGSNKDGYILTGETNTKEYSEFIQEPPQEEISLEENNTEEISE